MTGIGAETNWIWTSAKMNTKLQNVGETVKKSNPWAELLQREAEIHYKKKSEICLQNVISSLLYQVTPQIILNMLLYQNQ